MPERNRFFKGLASWIGFKQFRVDYEPAARAHGTTSWSPYALIGLSIEGLTSFSVAPLRLASLLGLLLALIALLFGASILWETMFEGKSVPGYPSLVVGLMVLGGVQLIMIGIMGEYIGKVLSEIKARPVYFVAEHSVRTAQGSRRPCPYRGAARSHRRRMSVAAPARARPADLAVCRRLRHLACRQQGDPRSRGAAAGSTPPRSWSRRRASTAPRQAR